MSLKSIRVIFIYVWIVLNVFLFNLNLEMAKQMSTYHSSGYADSMNNGRVIVG